MSNNRNRARNGRPRALPGDPEVLRLPAEGESDDEFTEREPLFSIGGKEYTTLTRVSAGVAIRYIELGLVKGPDYAVIWAMRYALGDDGFQALYSYKNLTPEHLARVTGIVLPKFDGAMTVPKARQSSV